MQGGDDLRVVPFPLPAIIAQGWPRHKPRQLNQRCSMTTREPISNETLEVLRNIPTQTLIDGLWVMGWPMSYIEGARPLQRGQSMSGRAVTLRFVPHRPDLAQDKPKGDQSAEYVAYELCGPGEVLVIDAMGWTYSSIGGDIKFLRLHQRGRGRPGHRWRGSGQQFADRVRFSGLFRVYHGEAGSRGILALAGQRRYPVRRRPGAARRRCRR